MTAGETAHIDVTEIAPEPVAAFEVAMASARASIDPIHHELTRRRMATLLGIDPGAAGDDVPTEKIDSLASWPTSPVFSDVERACLDVAEQFVVDVSAVSDEQRQRLTAGLGDDGAALYLQALYVIDFELRLRAAFRQLFGTDPLSTRHDTDLDLWPALEAMLVAVARLTALDPLTTELVRLRGARAHNCRFCQSLRNVRAVADGGDESTMDKIDDYEHSDLAEPHKVALRLTDAIIWQPAEFPPGLAADLHEHFVPAQVVEIVLDVARNALNKFAVAMGTDGAGVGEGLAYYDTDDHGELVYGLAPPP